MGIVYYLKRDDNRTLFDLGKHTGDWGEALASIDRSTPEIVAELEIACEEAGWDLKDPRLPPAYLTDVVERIKRWAEGRAFELVSEDGLDSWWDDESWNQDDAITGGRHRDDPH